MRKKAELNIMEASDRGLRVVAYARVSTDGQYKDENGVEKSDSSPEVQRRRCQDYLKVMNNIRLQKELEGEYKIVKFITDLGLSGKNTKRPGYQELIRLIESGQVGCVLTTELSRLSRSVSDFLKLVELCEKNKVQINVIGLNLETSSPFGRMMVIILVALAEFERGLTAHRTRENARNRLVKDGRINGSAEILGLDYDPKKKDISLPTLMS